VSLADLQNDEVAFRKFKLISEEVQGRNVLTNFHGMDMTTDKLRSMVKKWQVRNSTIISLISVVCSSHLPRLHNILMNVKLFISVRRLNSL